MITGTTGSVVPRTEEFSELEYGVQIKMNPGGVEFPYYMEGNRIENPETTLPKKILTGLDNFLLRNMDALSASGEMLTVSGKELLEKYQNA